MSEKEKKSRFEVSREVQEEFVNGIAETMLTLAEKAGEWQKGWAADTPLGMPFCVATGREYTGANMVRLLMASMVNDYSDDRWVTFKQLQEIQAKNPDQEMRIRKGEHGIKILRPEEIFFTIDEDGRWNFLNAREIKKLREAEANGEEIPEVKRKTLFYPFTVFNAAQIDGFPAKEKVSAPMTEIERNDFVERFTGADEYYAAKLHEFFHATGHESRENRQKKKEQPLKGYAFEEMRAEMFSMLAGAMLHLPMPEANSAAYINSWNQKFSGGEAKAIFQSASEAAKMLTMVCQYAHGEEPSSKWFPRKEQWPALIEMQRQRDIANGVDVHQNENSREVFAPVRRKPGPRMPEVVADFKSADNPALQARLILQSPEFLELALKQDTAQMRELADLCDHLAFVLSHEADAKLEQAQNTLENSIPLTEQRIAAKTRMRI